MAAVAGVVLVSRSIAYQILAFNVREATSNHGLLASFHLAALAFRVRDSFTLFAFLLHVTAAIFVFFRLRECRQFGFALNTLDHSTFLLLPTLSCLGSFCLLR